MKPGTTVEIDPLENTKQSIIRTVKMSDVSPRAVEWLWRSRIALGKLTVIAGDPGLGKSLLTTACFAAHVTTGRAWPDGSACPTGSVIVVSGEDDPEDTIRPRLDSAGAAADRVHYLQCVEDEDGERGFTLADVAPLAALLDSVGDCRLLVIDPVSAYLADTDSHKNSEVRATLMPLAKMAAQRSVAIVAVSHLNKAQTGSALLRVTGSLAFVAAARAAYVVARDAQDPAKRLFLPIKNNLGNDQTGLAYRIGALDGVPFVTWEQQAITITADQALGALMDSRRSTRDEACEFLCGLLVDGGLPVDAIRSESQAAGHSWATMRRAKKEIGVRSMKGEFNGHWSWYAPGSIVLNPKYADLSTFDKSEHLRASDAVDDSEDAQCAQHANALEGEHLPAASPTAERLSGKG